MFMTRIRIRIKMRWILSTDMNHYVEYYYLIMFIYRLRLILRFYTDYGCQVFSRVSPQLYMRLILVNFLIHGRNYR